MDNGATDHLTGELDKLGLKAPYYGKDHVHTANGQGMCISHVGHSTLATTSNKPLHLNDVLYVAQVTKILLSASKLAQDNDVFVEIHPYDIFVNDRASNDLFLSGTCRGGLYSVDSSPVKHTSFSQVFS